MSLQLNIDTVVCMLAMCSSMSKLTGRKTAQTSKMTAAWVDSMSTITISDDDDDDDDDDEAPASADNQPSHGTNAAVESAQLDADQPSTVTSSYVPENCETAKPLNTEELGGETSHVDVVDGDTADTTDTTKSVHAQAASADACSVEMLPDEMEMEKSKSAVQQTDCAEPHSADNLQTVDNLTTESTCVDDMNSGTEAAGIHSEHTPVDIPVIDKEQTLDSQVPEVSKNDKNEANTVEEYPVFSSGLLPCHFLISLLTTVYIQTFLTICLSTLMHFQTGLDVYVLHFPTFVSFYVE